jgi:hypothetical protein
MKIWRLAVSMMLLILSGCASTPPEVVTLHSKQTTLMQDLRRTHLAMIDAYVDQRLDVFEKFYFEEYGPAYRKNWEAAFKRKTGRDYSPDRDFVAFYNDLVAEYQKRTEPVVQLRANLRASLIQAYDQAMQAHDAVGAWIRSVERLQTSQRDALNRLLNAANPSLSLDSIEQELKRLEERVRAEIR